MKLSTLHLVVTALDGPHHALAVALLREEFDGAIEPQLPLAPTSRPMTAAERQAKRRRDIASRNVTADRDANRDMSRDIRDARALPLSDSSEILENSGGESSSLVTRESVTPVTKVTSRNVTPLRDIPRDRDERYISPGDVITPELVAIAEMVPVQDIRSAWLKFCGMNAGQWKHVVGAWQTFCAREAQYERTARHREADRAQNSANPLTAEGLDPSSYEASQQRKKRRRAEEEAERAEVRARLEAQKASAQ